jgi:molybdopterin-guanine dinucleotide biosynthesis protein A
MNSSELSTPAGQYPDLAAVLLAGGRSCRMGTDKALVPLGGQPALELLATRLRELTDQVLLSASDPSAYSFAGLPTICDVYPRRGPMSGLHAAMLHTTRPLILLLACDLPGVSSLILRRIIEASAGFDAVIPLTSDNRLHPVCAVYSRTCLPVIERNLRSGRNRMISLLDEPGLRIRQLNSLEGSFSDASLFDVNSPEDYDAFRRLSKS